MTDLDHVLEGALGEGRPRSYEELNELFGQSDRRSQEAIESEFGRAGWFTSDAEPYSAPEIPFDAPRPAKVPVVRAQRRLWLSRYNPADTGFDFSDINDNRYFPWRHPELAPIDGWWLSSYQTPAGRQAISEITTGDLVVCQRTDPGAQFRGPGDPFRTDMLVGVCVVGVTRAWADHDTGLWEHEACLVPLTKFDHPVPRKTARDNHRMRGPSFQFPRQLPGRQGPVGLGLSSVDWDDAIELLSVCGIAPEALAEPDTALLAARLRTSVTGNEFFLRLRYDAILQNDVRRQHEREAVAACERWAKQNKYTARVGVDWQRVPRAGFDLLFVDAAGKELQIEVKGYRSRSLASVHLQPSQARRARNAAAGRPPDWRLFALLGAGSKNPKERVLCAPETVRLLETGELKVK